MTRVSFVTALAVLGSIAALVACDKNEKGSATTTAASTTASATPATSAPATGMDKAHEQKDKSKEPVLTWKDGIQTPESVFYDASEDSYIVSNINGKPLDADNNGYLMKLSPEGKVTTPKWIEGGKNKVTLNAPKGIAVVDDKLYVTDIDTVRVFDKKTGAPIAGGDIKVPGATFLNDAASTADGKVLFTDTGAKQGAKGFEPTGTDAVYSYDPKTKKTTTLAKGKDLMQPNGVLEVSGKVWVNTFGSNELYMLDPAGKKTSENKLPKGTLDGLVAIPGGELLVSSWEGNAIYRGKPGGDWKAAIEDVKSPADIGFDTKRNRVVVPLFESNEVEAFDIR